MPWGSSRSAELLSFSWESDLEDRAVSAWAHAAPHGYSAVMVFDDPLGECQAKSGAALGFRREKGLEDRVCVIGWDAMTIIGDHKMNFIPALPQPETHNAVRGQGIECVGNQIRDDLKHFTPVHLGHQALREIFHYMHLSSIDRPFMDAERGFSESHQIH